MSSKRILVFSLAYYPMVGGAEIAIKEITDRLPDFEFDMITLRFSDKQTKFEKIGNIDVYRVGIGSKYLNKILFVPLAAIKAIALNKHRKYDMLWAMMTYMLFPVVLMRILGNRTPYALTLQDGDPFEHVFGRARIFPFLPMLFYGFRNAVRIQTISNFLANWARNMGYKEQLHVIPNGVDIKKFELSNRDFEKKDNIVLITTSRLVKKNGIGYVIKAMRFLSKSTKFRILGSGPLEASLKQLVKELGFGSQVEFLGNISNDDLPKYFANADIFVRPSISEGQGISFIEAMTAGLPVIATSVGGIPDFLKDRETGLFCEVNNPKNIADKVMEYINNPELTNKIIKNAKELAKKKYDWNLIVEDMRSKVFNIV